MLRKEDDSARRGRGPKTDPPPSTKPKAGRTTKAPHANAPTGPTPPDSGADRIVITPANLVPGQINVIAPPAGYPGRALLWPPPPPGEAVSPSRQGQYTFALYVSRGMGPVAVQIPNIQGFLFADLMDGVLPPSEGDGTIFDVLEEAINAQVEPPAPEGTGNDVPR
jgi:hypothetical protein